MQRQYYRSDITVHETAPRYIDLSTQLLSNEDKVDVLPILFRLYKSIESMVVSDDDAEVLYEETTTELKAKKLIRVPRSDTGMCPKLVTDQVLNDMDVPLDEQESILCNVVQAFSQIHHELSVIVMVVDIYEVTWQRHRRLNLIPAARFR